MRPIGNQKELEKRRIRAINFVIKNRLSQKETARRAAITERTMRKWLKEYRERGVNGIQFKPTPGRTPILTERQAKKLENMLIKGPRALNFDRDLWTCPLVKKLLDEKLNIQVSNTTAWRVLRRLGWTPQKPESKARERDEQQIYNWIKRDWPRIKKSY